MATPIDPSSTAFLMAESRKAPMHVGGLQLFEPPEGAGPDYVGELYRQMHTVEEFEPIFLKHPHRSVGTAGQYVWVEDEQFDLDHHLRHSALPQPGRIRELLDLCSRLHGTRLAVERPLWEAHVIEGLADGRAALYTKLHHALTDGVSAMRLLQSVLSSDPDERDMLAPWALRKRRSKAVESANLAEVPIKALRTALGLSADAAGMPKALVTTLSRGLRNESATLALYAPKTILNQDITASRRFAAQDWPTERLRGVGKATGATINDVLLAMCGGALRRYLLELDALPDTSLVAMCPVGLNAKQAGSASTSGGNAVGSVMVRLGTDEADPGARLRTIHTSMREGKAALGTMTQNQILAMTAIGMAPAMLTPLLRLQGMVRPPFNVIISNVPGPRVPQYFNGARLAGMYPLSIPMPGMALNITTTSYAGMMGFGLTGCRRTLPHLQRLLIHLEDELAALELAAGVN
ncbi:WS/DGAT/MGAT family O-acyltransferase [Nocardioides daejeonensis]|uniref:WS/DGAT/MGAT family O-acyltransferase n=1 Tax=Nocardioides daejeonensis TaxID=1046556 RepID=UPI000D74A327|nr:wax ester/triacylglycerol synthase family O-acyltransferase [Nocardioides daejeonensis]